jgi:hypothetical protein
MCWTSEAELKEKCRLSNAFITLCWVSSIDTGPLPATPEASYYQEITRMDNTHTKTKPTI